MLPSFAHNWKTTLHSLSGGCLLKSCLLSSNNCKAFCAEDFYLCFLFMSGNSGQDQPNRVVEVHLAFSPRPLLLCTTESPSIWHPWQPLARRLGDSTEIGQSSVGKASVLQLPTLLSDPVNQLKSLSRSLGRMHMN